MVLQPSTSASNNLLPRPALPWRVFFRMGAHVARASSDGGAVSVPATRLRGGGAIVMASQAFEPPEGDDAGLATPLADETLVTEFEASALERKQGRRLLALRTDQGEMSCPPTLSEMSEPVHVFLCTTRGPLSSGLTRSQSHRTQKWKSRTPAYSLRMSFIYTLCAWKVAPGPAATVALPPWLARDGTQIRRQFSASFRGSPAMNRVPGRKAISAWDACHAIIGPDFRNLISLASNCTRFRDFREFSSI